VFNEIAHPVEVLRNAWVAAIPFLYNGETRYNQTRNIAATLTRNETAGTEQWHVAVALHSWATSALGLAHAGATMDVPAISVRQFDRAGREL
jgi:hypothetical protein